MVDGQVPYSQTPHLTAGKTVYVATTGSDSNPGTREAPFRTIQAAINSIPKDLGGYSAIIRISSGTYSENIAIEGFYGGSNGINSSMSFSITLIPDDSAAPVGEVLIKGLVAVGEHCSVLLSGLKIVNTVSGFAINSKSSHICIHNCDVDSETGCIDQNAGILWIENCTLNCSGSTYCLMLGPLGLVHGTTIISSGTAVCVGVTNPAYPGLAILSGCTIQGASEFVLLSGSVAFKDGVQV